MPKQKLNQSEREGFTIIEVVLVLAIAGLIFLMVFVALPALQRSQRDTQRRNDMSRVDTSLVQYQTNNSTKSNNLPPAGSWVPKNSGYGDTGCGTNSACIFIRDYMNSGAAGENTTNSFEDPDGVPYSLVITSNWAEGTPTWTSVVGQKNQNGTTIVSNLVTSGDGYTINTGSFSDHVIYIIPGGKCDGEIAVKSDKRHFAILYRLEGAGVYCIDDQ